MTLLPEPPDADSSPSPFERIGGRAAVERVVDAFYDRIEADAELSAVFPADLGPGRAKQKLFMEQWLGGEPLYSQRYGEPRLRRRHFPFVISERAAGRWLRHMSEALRECDVDAGVRAEMLAGLGPLAQHMVNEGEPVSREPLPKDAFLT